MTFNNIIKSILSHRLGIIPYPYFVTYLFTMRCNLKCFFCDIWKNQDSFKDELTLDKIKTAFRNLRKIDVLRISGGEPFLRKDIAEAINAIQGVSHPEMIHITSNGTLTRDIVDCLKKIQNPEKIHIKISIDAIGSRHDEIRGVGGTYKKAINTIKELIALRAVLNFHLGVNCAIVKEGDIADYYQLRKMLTEYNVFIYPVVANIPTNALYSNKEIVCPERGIEPIGNFQKDGLKKLIYRFIADAENIDNFKEKVVDRYHLRGLRNRLIFNVDKPNPKCVALTSHIRVMPNGDVPTCLFNSSIVGNLLRDSFDKLWFHNEKINQQRKWVRGCSGCWQSCESIVSAIYTGDIYKGLV